MPNPKKKQSNPQGKRIQRRRKRMTRRESELANKASFLRRKLATLRPPTPLMLRPIEAWKVLCARTGSSISISTFYNWIDNMSVPAIRVGRNIFVPKVVLEDLINRCLNGERL